MSTRPVAAATPPALKPTIDAVLAERASEFACYIRFERCSTSNPHPPPARCPASLPPIGAEHVHRTLLPWAAEIGSDSAWATWIRKRQTHGLLGIILVDVEIGSGLRL